MFGYVKTDTPYMYVKDTVLYKAMYCGLCKSISKTCGQKGRFVLNYDLTFLSIFLHNILGIDVEVNKEHCIIHWFTKRPITKTDELTNKIACLNVILAYYKVADDILDDNKGRFAKSFLKSAYKKAKRLQPELDKIVKVNFEKLLIKEKEKCDSLDVVAHPFGFMMQEIVKNFLEDKATEEILSVSYSLGKWIYLIDAIDDFEKDIKKKDYNVFVVSNPNIVDKATLIKENNLEIQTVFGTILSDIIENSKKIKYQFNHDLIDNIFYKGLFNETKRVMEGKQCKNTTNH